MKAPKSESIAFDKHPEGACSLVCTQIIDFGTVYNQKKDKDEHKIFFLFESSILQEDGKPFKIFASYNFTMYQNSMLCKFIENWRGKMFSSQEEADDYDLKDRLGKPAYGNVVYNGDFVNLQPIMPLPSSMTAPVAVGELHLFDMETQDDGVFQKLSQKMQERIRKAKEFRSGKPIETQFAGKSINDALDELDKDIPF